MTPLKDRLLVGATAPSRLRRNVAFAFAFAFATAAVFSPASASTVVRFNTNAGNIDVRLFDNLTPNSVANFLSYVTTGRYEDTFFHRVPQLPTGGTSDFVVQGGGFRLNNSIFDAEGIELDAPIGPEFNLSNLRGSLAFATNSLGATSQFFFNVSDNLFLDDSDFTVFGRIINDGQQVVDFINDLPAVDASPAANGPGEDFDEIPVFDIDPVIAANDITGSDAVVVSSVEILSFGAGDYNFDGETDAADFNVFQSQFGSLRDAEADANGDGAISVADFTSFRDAVPAAPISSLPPGDFNQDGSVTSSDFNIFERDFGLTGSPSADGNLDGEVNGADFPIFRDNLSVSAAAIAPVAAFAVPEPTTLAGVASCLTIAVLRRRR